MGASQEMLKNNADATYKLPKSLSTMERGLGQTKLRERYFLIGNRRALKEIRRQSYAQYIKENSRKSLTYVPIS